MIYVSTSCVKKTNIADAVRELATHGFTAIELSGGTHYYDDYLSDLLQLKKEYGLNYLIHNYFPPPKDAFVLNLASLDNSIFTKSLEHCKRAIEDCKVIGSPAYGIHAGFFINIQVNEIGKPLSKDSLYDQQKCIDRFCKAFAELQEYAGSDVKLYIENNVISAANYNTFNQVNPLMCTNVENIEKLSKRLSFQLILDVAHLKVSSKTLGLTFDEELSNLFNRSDYIHLSDNDGTKDSNEALEESSSLYEKLRKLDFRDKIVTLEVYDSLDKIKSSYDLIQTIKNA